MRKYTHIMLISLRPDLWIRLGLLGILVLLSFLQGCSSKAVVAAQTEFPVPIMPSIDLNMGLYLDEALTQYVHEESIEQMGDWRIELGAAQKAMFIQLAQGMFQHSQLVDSIHPAKDTVDAVLHPIIQDFQFSTPEQTRSDYYEVWLKYQIELYDANGQLIAQWPLTAYGKSNTQNYGFMKKKREPALMEATRVALRDGEAFFALKFARIREVADWLENRRGSKGT